MFVRSLHMPVPVSGTKMCGYLSDSAVIRNPTVSLWHVLEHPSPLTWLLSSHCSPGSISPSPQVLGQSLSLVKFAPGGQQPSPLAGRVMGVCTQCAWQFVPTNVSVVHTSVSAHVVGQAPGFPCAMAVSHCSPGSTTPLPHRMAGGPSISGGASM